MLYNKYIITQHGDFMKDYYKGIADVFEPVGQTVGTSAEIKAIDLEQKRVEKLASLGPLRQGGNLENTASVTEAGTIESNKNKIWNEYTPEERQYILGYATSKYGTESENPAEARRVYLYGTKDGHSKFGVSTGAANTSDVRYDNTIDSRYTDDWRKSGSTGPDLNNKVMDIKLQYPAATALEGIEHGNKQNLQDRKYGDYFSDEALAHDSGVSEYYNKTAADYYGDSTNKVITPERQAQLEKEFDEYTRLVGAQAKGKEEFATAPKSLSYDEFLEYNKEKDSSSWVDALQAFSKRQAAVPIAYIDSLKQGDISNENIKNNLERVQETADYTSGYNTDRMGEFEKARRAAASGVENVSNKIVGAVGEGLEQIGGGLLGIKAAEDSFIKNENDRLSKIYPGESTSSVLDELPITDVADWLKKTGRNIQKDSVEFEKNNKTSTLTGYDTTDLNELYSQVDKDIKEKGYIHALGNAVTDIRSVQALSQSIPEMIALATSVGSMAIVNANHNINIGEDRLGREMTTSEKAKSTATSIVSTYLDRFGDKVMLEGMPASKAALKYVVDNSPAAVKRALADNFGSAILNISKAPLKVATAAGIEYTTEKYQTLGEMAAQNPEIFNRGFTDKEYAESDVAGIMGATMATHLTTPRAYKELLNANKSSDKAGKTVEETTEFVDNDVAAKFVPTEEGDVDTSKYQQELQDMSIEELMTEKTKMDSWVATKLASTEDEEQKKAYEDLHKMSTELYTKEVESRGTAAEVEQTAERKTNQIKAEESGLADKLNSVDVSDEDAINLVRDYINSTAMEDVVAEDGTVARVYKPKITEELVNNIASAVVSKFRVSGMDLDNSTLADEIADELKTRVESAGVGFDGIKREPKQYKDKTSNKLLVDNEVLSRIYDNELTPEIVNELGITGENTKQTQQVLNKLRTDSQTGSREVVDTLNKVGNTLKKTIADKLEDYSSRGVLKGTSDKVAGNLLRLATLGLNVINSAVVSDTELRQELSAVDGNNEELAKNEYYGSKSKIEAQIGKEYADSYGIRVTGTPEQVLAKHRKMGRLALEVLKDSELINESESNVAFKLSENTVTSNNENAKSAKAGTKNYNRKNSKAFTDNMSDEFVETYYDKGIKLSDSSSAIEDITGTEVEHSSAVGDAIKRLSKLLKPSNIMAPEREPNRSWDIKTDPAVKLSGGDRGNVAKVIRELRSKPLAIKNDMLDMLIYLRDLRAEKGSLNKALKGNKALAIALNLEETGVSMLAASEKGSNNAKLDALNGILDELDNISQDGKAVDLYFDYQVDVNNRISVLQTVLNFQHDKVYSRQILSKPDKMVYKNKSKAKEYLLNAVLEEFGFSPKPGVNPEEYYKQMRKELASGNSSDPKLQSIMYQAAAFKTRDPESKLEALGGLVSNSRFKEFNKFRGQTFKLMNLLGAVNDIVEAKDGEVITDYMVEMDASASGAFNTLLNIAGRNPSKFKVMLGKLGLHKVDEKRLDSSDVYLMVGENVYNKVMNADERDSGASKYYELQDMMKELEGILGRTALVRDLAKSPVMTWFYSAGDASITKNMVKSLIEIVFEEATRGNLEAIAHIKKITGVGYKDVKPGSPEHKKLIEHYKPLGEVYTTVMKKEFKEVDEYKQEITELFNILVQNSTVDGKDYWGGVVRSASSVYDSDEAEPSIERSVSNNGNVIAGNGTTSVYKMKEVISGLSAKEKSDIGITDDEQDITLTTVLENKPNATSVGPLTEQGKDAAELFASLDEMFEVFKNGSGVMTVHDAEYGDANELLVARDAYHESVLKINRDGDNIEGFLKAYDFTIAGMEEALKTATGAEKTALAGRISTLKKTAEAKRAENAKRIEAKEKLLEATTLEMFGMQKADRTTSGEDKTSNAVVKKEKAEEVEKAKEVEGSTLAKASRDILNSNPVFFDIETNFSTNPKDNVVIEIGFSDAVGNSKEYFISSDGNPVSKDIYLLGNTEDSLVEKGLQSYATYVSRFHKAKTAGMVVPLDDAVNSMLDSGSVLVGYNSSNFDIPSIIKGVSPDTKSRITKSTAVDYRNSVTAYTGDKRGTQSDLSNILGKHKGNHTSSEDAKALLEIVKEFASTTDISAQDLKYKVVIEKFKTALSNGKVTSSLVSEVLSWSGYDISTDLGKATFMTRSMFLANVPSKVKSSDLSAIVKADKSQRAWEVGGYVVLNDESDVFTDPKALAATILHEVEHTVTKGYIEANMGKSAELVYLGKVARHVKEFSKKSGKKTNNSRAQRLLATTSEQEFVEELVAVFREDPSAFANVARELGIPGENTKNIIQKILQAVGKLISDIMSGKEVQVDLPYTVAALEQLSKSGREFTEESTSNKVSNIDISDLEIKGCK